MWAACWCPPLASQGLSPARQSHRRACGMASSCGRGLGPSLTRARPTRNCQWRRDIDLRRSLTHLSHLVEKAPTTVRGNGCLWTILAHGTLPPTAPTAAAKAKSPANLKLMRRRRPGGLRLPGTELRSACGDGPPVPCPLWGRGMVALLRRRGGGNCPACVGLLACDPQAIFSVLILSQASPAPRIRGAV